MVGSTSVVVSRRWNDAAVTVQVSNAGLAMSVSIEDFVRALVASMPSPALEFTKSALESAAIAAIPAVLEGIKEASAHAP
jgi:hypothetical protein